jgi:RNA pol II promoter Fmp27 protein domain
MSLSLTTATEQSAASKRMNSIHLTPKTFTHFWHWKGLFNDALALPIRQGRMWPSSRPLSEKFGRHLATLKYRIQIKNLALSHVYKQDSLESIAKGDIPVVGVKGVINSFAADFHQRDQEVQIYDSERKQMRFIRSKPMYTAEVAMDGLDLRCVLAIFSETPVEILAHANPYESPYVKIPFLASTEDPTFDADDFVEVDWKPNEGDDPRYFVGEIVNCPAFAFFKKVEQVASPGDPGTYTKLSKFGDEPTHRCLLKHEPSMYLSSPFLSFLIVPSIRSFERSGRDGYCADHTAEKGARCHSYC